MTLKIGSLLAFGLVLLGVFYLIEKDHVFSKNIIAILIQLVSLALMIWARITFGVRSFHASANTTKGELITSGPYRFFRHPIYAALIYFFWACIISFPFVDTIIAVVVITIGLFVRILLEEKSLKETYKIKYEDYSHRTNRIIPYIF